MDHLPPHITHLTSFGERAEWSHDGKKILFLSKTFGDAMEIDLATKQIENLTALYPHHGYTRALYLADGDILLSGPETFTPETAGQARRNCFLYVLDKSSEKPPVPLGVRCNEGPAVSRNSLRIAWTRSDYPDSVVFGRSEIWTGEIVVERGVPRLVDRVKRLDRAAFHYLAFFETQDFRPPGERELIFTAYAHRGGEVMGLDLETGALTNYSRNWGYDEAEGVFPDGSAVAVEREPDTWTLSPRGHLDIWRTALDGSGTSVRLTRFSEFAGYGANNPVVSPDGRFMAFGLREVGGPHGNGRGIFVMDLRGGRGD